MIEADSFFLTEEFGEAAERPEYDLHDTGAGTVALPVANRKPNEAGFVLTWREFNLASGQTWADAQPRTGMVLSLAPRQRAVWVVPDQPRAGEGYAVVVDNVTATDQAFALRRIGGPGDYLSTAGWQRPRTLPRAVLRIDRFTVGDAEYTRRYLHADRRCPVPAGMPGEQVRRGPARRVEQCYVFAGFLHPKSVRPIDPSTTGIAARWVPACGVCLRDGAPR